jgi:hypothetical protein
VLVEHAVLRLVDAVVFVDLGVRGAKRRDLDDLVAETDVREVKAAADQSTVTEDAPDVLGVRIGGNVEILRLHVEQQVAHGAADEERLMARILEPVEHFQCGRRDVRARNRVFGARYDRRLRRSGRDLVGWTGRARPEEFREREQVVGLPLDR